MTGPQGDPDQVKSDEEIRDVAGAMAGTRLSHDDAGDSIDVTGTPADLPTSTSGPSPTFGNWRQASSSRPAIVLVSAHIHTDGTTDGEVDLEVDESGGTTADYTEKIGHAEAAVGGGLSIRGHVTVYLPAGAQYRIVNSADPDAANSIQTVREAVL